MLFEHARLSCNCAILAKPIRGWSYTCAISECFSFQSEISIRKFVHWEHIYIYILYQCNFKELLRFLYDLCLELIVGSQTRITPHCSPSMTPHTGCNPDSGFCNVNKPIFILFVNLWQSMFKFKVAIGLDRKHNFIAISLAHFKFPWRI